MNEENTPSEMGLEVWDAVEQEKIALADILQQKDRGILSSYALMLLGMEEVIERHGLDGFRDILSLTIKVVEDPYLH